MLLFAIIFAKLIFLMWNFVSAATAQLQRKENTEWLIQNPLQICCFSGHTSTLLVSSKSF